MKKIQVLSFIILAALFIIVATSQSAQAQPTRRAPKNSRIPQGDLLPVTKTDLAANEQVCPISNIFGITSSGYYIFKVDWRDGKGPVKLTLRKAELKLWDEGPSPKDPAVIESGRERGVYWLWISSAQQSAIQNCRYTTRGRK